jgi:hypothetical protein
MAGLVPAIHVFSAPTFREGVDARHEAGHDDLKRVADPSPLRVAAPAGRVYIAAMLTKTQTNRQPPAGSARPLTFVVLRDHSRLPSRFFGRLTASIQAAL